MCDSRLAADDANEHTSRMSTLDLYEDLLINDEEDGGDRVFSMQEILSDKRTLQEQNSLLLRQLVEAKIEAQRYLEEKASLQKNFDNLLATAKAELERKNSLLGHYMGESDHRSGRPSASSRSLTSKGRNTSSKKKGLLELYKGKRVDEKALPAPKSSTQLTPTTLLQHRGEKMIGVATRVVGSSFENLGATAAKSLLFNQQTNKIDKVHSSRTHGQQDEVSSSASAAASSSRHTSSPANESADVRTIINNNQSAHNHPHQSCQQSAYTYVTSSHHGTTIQNQNDIRTQTESSKSKYVEGNSDKSRNEFGRQQRECRETGMSPVTFGQNSVQNRQFPRLNKQIQNCNTQQASRSPLDGQKPSVAENKMSTPNPTEDSTKSCSSNTIVLSNGGRSHNKDMSSESKNSAKSSPRHRSLVSDSAKDCSRSTSRSKRDRVEGKSDRKNNRTKERSHSPFRNRSRRWSSSRGQDRKSHGYSSMDDPCRKVRDNEKLRKKADGSRDVTDECAEMCQSYTHRYESDSKANAELHGQDCYESGSVSKRRTSSHGSDWVKSLDVKKPERCRGYEEKRITFAAKEDDQPIINQNIGSVILEKPQSMDNRGSDRQRSETKRNMPICSDKRAEVFSKECRSPVRKNYNHLNQKSARSNLPRGMRSYSPQSVNKDICKVTHMVASVDTCLKDIACGTKNNKRNKNHPPTKLQRPRNKQKGKTNQQDATMDKKTIPDSSCNVSLSCVSQNPPESVPTPRKQTPSRVSVKHVEDLRSECTDFQSELELDYDEDSLMNREIMQPDETYPAKEIPSCKENITSKERSGMDAGRSKLSLAAAINTVPCFSKNHSESTMATNPSPGVSKKSEESRLPLKSDVEKIALTPNYQPLVKLVDIAKSPVSAGIKRKVSFNSDTGLSKEEERLIKKSHSDKDASKTASRNNGSKVCNTKVSIRDFAESQNGSFSVATPISSSLKTDYEKISLDLPVTPSPNTQNGKKVADSAVDISTNSECSPSLNIGMEVEIETSPAFSSKTKRKSRKKTKKRTLKVKIKTFKKDKRRKTAQDDRNQTEHCISSPKQPMKPQTGTLNTPTTQKARNLPEASPILSQWLDSAKKKKEVKEKVCNISDAVSLTETVDVSSMENNLNPSNDDSLQAAVLDEDHIELASAIASICDSSPVPNPNVLDTSKISISVTSTYGNSKRSCNDNPSVPETSKVSLSTTSTYGNSVRSYNHSPSVPDTSKVSLRTMSTSGNSERSYNNSSGVPDTSKVSLGTTSIYGSSMRSYNNAALKWLFILSQQKLKSLVADELPLDLSLEKKPLSDRAKSLSETQHTSAVINLFSPSSVGNKSDKNNNKSSSNGDLAIALEEPRGYSRAIPVVPSAYREKNSKEENFDELLKKHSDHQKVSATKRKKDAGESGQLPSKVKKPRRVALERVEMPEPKPKKTQEIVSPLSRSLWVSSLEKCQERRKKQARWSSEVCHDSFNSPSEINNSDPSVSESGKVLQASPSQSTRVTPRKVKVKPVLPDCVVTSQLPKPLPEACQPQESSERTSSSSRFSVGDLFADTSSSSWQLSEESKSRFYSFAKAVKILSPLKLTPDKVTSSQSRTDKGGVRRKVLQSP